MKLKPLASESMGVRSMAFLAHTPKLRIVVDPGVALGPWRFGLEPHPQELARLDKLKKNLIAEIKKADVLTISHYHYDHYIPDMPEVHKDKTMLIKHPTENINKSQQGRSSNFLRDINELPREIKFADSQSFEFEDVEMRFSDALPHGTNTRLGYVISLAITHRNKTFVHTSDVEGPSLDEQLDFILESQPETLACDGPMSYLMHRYGKKAMEASIRNLQKIITETPVKTMILDHHFLRDKNWAKKIEPVFSSADAADCKIRTYAEYAGEENNLLESLRKELYKEGPVKK